MRQQQSEQRDAAHVEQQNAPHHRVNCPRHFLLRIFRFPGGSAQVFGATVSEQHPERHSHHSESTLGEQAAMIGNRSRSRMVNLAAYSQADSQNQNNNRQNHEDYNRRDLNHREPELELPEELNGSEIHDHHQRQSDKSPAPLGNHPKDFPVMHIVGDGGDIGH